MEDSHIPSGLTTGLSRQLSEQGWAMAPSGLDASALTALRDSVFHPDHAGRRCLLDEPLVAQAATRLRENLIALGAFPQAVAIQAIAFDKNPGTNWKVAWHQDLMFPFAAAVRTPGFDLPSLKDGIHYARPPVPVLENLLAARLHLDDCGETNGPLRVCSASHRHGIIPSDTAASYAKTNGETTCTAACGEVLLMRPLTLHASSVATEPRHRRVLHFVYYSGDKLAERWHRTV